MPHGIAVRIQKNKVSRTLSAVTGTYVSRKCEVILFRIILPKAVEIGKDENIEKWENCQEEMKRVV